MLISLLWYRCWLLRSFPLASADATGLSLWRPSPFTDYMLFVYCIDILMIWHVLYLYYFMFNKSYLSLRLRLSLSLLWNFMWWSGQAGHAMACTSNTCLRDNSHLTGILLLPHCSHIQHSCSMEAVYKTASMSQGWSNVHLSDWFPMN